MHLTLLDQPSQCKCLALLRQSDGLQKKEWAAWIPIGKLHQAQSVNHNRSRRVVDIFYKANTRLYPKNTNAQHPLQVHDQARYA